MELRRQLHRATVDTVHTDGNSRMMRFVASRNFERLPKRVCLRIKRATMEPTNALSLDRDERRQRKTNALRSGMILTGVTLALAIEAPASVGPSYDRASVLVFNEENDLFLNTDRHYTQGLRFAYLHEDGHTPLGMTMVNGWLPAWGFDLKSARSGYGVGQSMYTPANLNTVQRVPLDRPYAGWLHLDWILQRSGITHTRQIPVQESWELELGVMGSPSLAQQAQTWVHAIRGFDLPQGWRNQLRDEPGFRLKYERSYRLDLTDPSQDFGLQLLPWGGGVLGTVEDTLRLGGMLRMGFVLPDDHGVRIIDSLSTTSGGQSRRHPRRWGAYGFVGTEGRLVGHNSFLDGNLVRSSPNVAKNFIVGDVMVGFNVVLHSLELGYTHAFRTPEFKNQTEANQFGSVYVKIRF